MKNEIANGNSLNIKGIIIGFILACVAMGATYYWYMNYYKINKVLGRYGDSTRVLSHHVLVNMVDFGEDTVDVKFMNGNCVPVSTPEKRKIKEDLLSNKKTLKYEYGAKRNWDGTDHQMWVVENNLVSEQNADDFTKYYFSSTFMCKAYIEDRDELMRRLNNIYVDER